MNSETLLYTIAGMITLAAVFILTENFYEIKDELQKIDKEAKKTRETITHLDAIAATRKPNTFQELEDFEPIHFN